MKTHEVKAALRRHYKPAEYALMFEVGNATGVRQSRWADAVVMNLWPSRGLLIEGIEIKVSRSDWRRELDNPAKAEAIAKYCDHWWIVAPKGIVHEHEIPALWGYKEVSEAGNIRTVKKAPKKDAVPADRGFIAAMLRRASEADASEINALVSAQVSAERDAINSRIENEVERRTRRLSKLEDTFKSLKEKGLDLSHPYLDVAEVLEALEIGRKVINARGFMLDNTVKNYRSAADSLQNVIDSLSDVCQDSLD